MISAKTQHCWEAFLKFYSKQNKGRKTRLGVFESEGEVVTDYWIEDGLELSGIDLDTTGGPPAIEVLLDGYSHIIEGTRSLHVHFSHDSEEDGMDITDEHGRTTILRFERS